MRNHDKSEPAMDECGGGRDHVDVYVGLPEEAAADSKIGAHDSTGSRHLLGDVLVQTHTLRHDRL